ncbi:MAG: CRISPR-associated protein Csx11 [Anaerolineae bacterium]|nr:CRISPR-associated protein Csx11 [Anaerolineae bacterium]
MSQLDILAQYHNEILLAEAIGWLHDYRKCSDEILNRGGGVPRSDLFDTIPQLRDLALSVSSLFPSESIVNLLHDYKRKADDATASLLLQYLSRCHNTAHFDKQDPVDGVPIDPIVQISSPFGFSVDIPSNLTAQLWSLPWSNLNDYSVDKRKELRKAIETLFSQTVADTRRPINEVDLWSWGLLVGALYKAALAGALLSGSATPAHDLRWRLLSIRINGLDYLVNVARIPDLLARQQLLSDGLNRVQDLLETTLPIGSEVYRDENGSVYVVPDTPDLLEKIDSCGNSLRMLIMQAFEQGMPTGDPALRIGGEVIPDIVLEQTPWWGQDPDYLYKTGRDQGHPLYRQAIHSEPPGIGRLLSQYVVTRAKVDEIGQFWRSGTVADVCTVCGLRPQRPSREAVQHNVCDICEKRRAGRSQRWATSQSGKTIWTDEVADTNGRLALIVGQFDLSSWLSGNLIESLLLIAPHDPENDKGKAIASKAPSFSRLRRIWETTRHFWQGVQAESLQKFADDRRRLVIHLDSVPGLRPFHVYDMDLGATTLSVVWVPPQGGNDGYLISADNLSYIACQLNAAEDVYTDPATAAIFVEDYISNRFVVNGHQSILHNPDTRTGQVNTNLLLGIRIVGTVYQETQYATVIPIFAEPRVFMAIVPSDKSSSIIKDIKEKYDNEMGKVRDRLPIYLGVVYASRRTPIRAVLEAGRAMLSYQGLPQYWTVERVSAETQADATHFSRRVDVNLKHGDYHLAWRIPINMNDGETPDRWYPYFYLDTPGNDASVDTSARCVVSITQSTENEQTKTCWIVHAADLRIGEIICVRPSRFDFEFLDTTARRFEIHYGEDGRRPLRRTRPFYLEDLDRLDELWEDLKRLEKSQRHQVIATIEATREAWFGHDRELKSLGDGVFRQFVRDTLAGAAWPGERTWKDICQDRMDKKLEDAGVRGELADLAELHMEILKE